MAVAGSRMSTALEIGIVGLGVVDVIGMADLRVGAVSTGGRVFSFGVLRSTTTTTTTTTTVVGFGATSLRMGSFGVGGLGVAITMATGGLGVATIL